MSNDQSAREKFEEIAATVPREELLSWIDDRYENCLRIAAEKSGDDAMGWIEDAAYFKAVLNHFAALDGWAVSQETRGTMECPICGVAGQHTHSHTDIDFWVRAQASRFGCFAYAFPACIGRDGFIEKAISDLELEQRSFQKAMGYEAEGYSRPIAALKDYLAALRTPQQPGSERDIPKPAEVERISDMSVRVRFLSCAEAGRFAAFLAAEKEPK